MKAVILAAGKGNRIHSLTNGAPKSLLPLSDTTLLGHSLRNLASAGVLDLVVVTGYCRSEITKFVRDNWLGTVEFVFNSHFDCTNVLYSFWLALPYLKEKNFIFLHADTVFSYDVLERLLGHLGQANMVFAVDYHRCEDEEMKVRVVNGKVVEVTKEMPPDTADGEFLGLAWVSGDQIPSLRRHAEALFQDGVFNAFFELAVQRMIDQDGLLVDVANVSGMPWREVDFPEDYEAARCLFG